MKTGNIVITSKLTATQINETKGADVASANALKLGGDGNYFDITGTTAITSINTLGIGTVICLHFDGVLVLTHHATDLILPSGANITTSAGDEAIFIEYATGDWRCIVYTKADGTAVVGGTGITEQEFTASIAHLTTDAGAGKAFTVASFPTHGIIKKLKVRADFIAGQQTAGSALVNSATGIAPADTSIAYDGVSGSFAINDYIWIDNECMLVTVVGTPFTVTRAQKGTVAGYHDDNTQITKANNGLRLVLYKDSTKKEVDRVIELNNLMTWLGVTDGAITAGDKLFGLTADIKNVDKDDYVLIDDTTDEEAIVQNVNHDVASATYDYTIFVKDTLAAHAITKDVYKQIVYDIPTPYKSTATTLYGTLSVDEAISATVNVTLEITTDKYT